MHHHRCTQDSFGDAARRHYAAFSQHGFKSPFGPGSPMSGFGPGGTRARRGDVRAGVLRLLSEEPMHGYQIIQELAARSDGLWTPSAGSVYPTLQQLADEDLIIADQTGGKKVFSLTETGVAEVAKTADQPAPWELVAQSDSGMGEYRSTVGKLGQAAFQIGASGSKEQRAAAVDVLTEARKKLYAILAED